MYQSDGFGVITGETGCDFEEDDPRVKDCMIRVFHDVEAWLTKASDYAIQAAVDDFNKIYGPGRLSVIQMRRFCQILDAHK
ncbi:hypothetical protein [Photobacterium damselae]|uniref:hypothetical protein n=1 Tax=Photobacterium damselae TaxID=38293 RepID=UPI001F31183D|nr:hypothetical protein [Photobacterium damselae]UKA12952.1 hypothetical protein IHC91_21445 [Photobacterium damselae subsp. damselae]